MTEAPLILVTGAGGGTGGVGNKVVALLREQDNDVRAMAHHDDDRALALRALGADVVVGDLLRPTDVASALDSVQRMFFSMSLAPTYLEATATVATVACAVGHLDALVAISQMTVSQMDALSTSESLASSRYGVTVIGVVEMIRPLKMTLAVPGWVARTCQPVELCQM